MPVPSPSQNHMYLEYWGLTQSPFPELPDPRCYFRGPDQEEALARMEFLVQHRKRLGILEGAEGLGKTLTLAVLARQLRRRGCQVASINMTGKGEAEMLWDLAAALGTGPRQEDRVPQLWRRIADKIVENRYGQVTTVMLCDDFAAGGLDFPEFLTRLMHIDTSPDARWTVILAGTPAQFVEQGPRLAGAVGLPIELRTWEVDDVVAYLQQAVHNAGRSESPFEPLAIQRLHLLTEGNPRHINRLAELALLAGAADQVEIIDAELLAAVAEDLTFTSAHESVSNC